jgi:hypothetical protein
MIGKRFLRVTIPCYVLLPCCSASFSLISLLDDDEMMSLPDKPEKLIKWKIILIGRRRKDNTTGAAGAGHAYGAWLSRDLPLC